ncbi:MAG: type I 3-dehydroquinate dehydratase [Vicinamibacterales bacterium]|jgi:3-dehydroquinate dehydratase/shikimate dehydrogenase|nr:hypothetical protein [Acidobacteriota bacterium]MDP7294621.1 type I 3-dehydroquinate dehydratase [Vicinamibacterales bacterium]MDP7691703.1 type I 3-dehydroquinate dehydratase [Vicinamibacterales bacterium]HJO37190.1 type I 3-dehydroquinate dehydratase [Vicinamibacterales bacterium]
MQRPQLCVTVTAGSTAELRRRRDATVDADLIELRLDGVRDLDVKGAIQGRQTPVIVTCRGVRDGGRFDGSENERRRLIDEALTCGAEFVDLEWTGSPDPRIAAEASRVVLSSHLSTFDASELEPCYRAMRATGAAVVKIAAPVDHLMDLVPMAVLGRRAAVNDERAVLLGMGPAGAPSRLLASRFGACWSYAGSVAPGQFSAARMVREFRYRDIGVDSELYGVVGNPVGHSVSPAMHNAGFAAAGRDAVYLPLTAADADDFFGFAEAFGLTGASVTAPFKGAAFERVATTDDVGRRIGAVNTVRRCGEDWQGMNSDVPGFLEPLTDRLACKGLRATVLGAGGAARAAALALVEGGASVDVCARVKARAEETAGVCGAQVGTFPPVPGSWDLLVNATPVGTSPKSDVSPMPSSALDGGFVYDLVYNPNPTRLMREAAAQGCATLGGLEMLVAQAERQFEWWTGARPADSVFATAARAWLTDTRERGA